MLSKTGNVVVLFLAFSGAVDGKPLNFGPTEQEIKSIARTVISDSQTSRPKRSEIIYINDTVPATQNYLDTTCFTSRGLIAQTTSDACFAAAGQITDGGGKASAQSTWSTDPTGTERRVPARWQSGNCQIQLTPEGQQPTEDSFSRQDLLKNADEIVRDCVQNSGYRLGGSALVGEKKVLRLTVYGRKKPGWTVPQLDPDGASSTE